MSKTGHTNCLLKSSTELHDFLLSASRSSFLLKSTRNSSEIFDAPKATGGIFLEEYAKDFRDRWLDSLQVFPMNDQSKEK